MKDQNKSSISLKLRENVLGQKKPISVYRNRIKFGTSGWRGIIGEDFTTANLCLVIQGIANYLKKAKKAGKGIVVGYDTRFMSAEFAAISVRILQENGIPVFFTDRDTPTPVIAFHIKKFHAAGAVNITASHNPAEYSGVKFSTAYSGPASDDVTIQIEKEIKTARPIHLSAGYKLPRFNPRPDYIRQILKMIDTKVIRKAGLKIIVDCMHGASRGYLDYILSKLDVDLKVLHKDINPLFDGHGPNPKKENLTELRDTVRSAGADLGLATDGDADRFGIIDSDGSYISADNVLVLILDHLLKTRKYAGGVVRSITTTHMLDAIAKRYKRPVYEVLVGFKYVGSAVLEKDAVMGGEESGGMTMAGHISDKDGILACLLIAEIVALRKKSLRELIKELRAEYGRFYNKRMDIRVKPEMKKHILDKVKNYSAEKIGGIKINSLLRLKNKTFKFILSDSSWIIIRPSGTEPIFRCYAESFSKKRLGFLENSIKKLMGL